MLARPGHGGPRDGTVLGGLRGQRVLAPPRRSSDSGLGRCLPHFLLSTVAGPAWGREPALPAVRPSHVRTQHRSSAPAGSRAGTPPAPLHGRGFGGVSLPSPTRPGERSGKDRGAETFLAASRFCHLPLQTCPCKSFGWVSPPLN